MPVWTDIDWDSPAISWLLFGCNSIVVTEPCMADFVLVTEPASMPDLSYFRIARCENREKATTLIVQVEDIMPSPEWGQSNIPFGKLPRLEHKGIPDSFWNQWRQLSSLYPCGIDVFFTCEDVLTALPKIIPLKS
jgi:alpha-D-ribose 1-methylphosphonate 5-triphosphate synthase subunit PhnH